MAAPFVVSLERWSQGVLSRSFSRPFWIIIEVGNLVLGSPDVAFRGPWDKTNITKVAPTGPDLARGLFDYHLDFPGSAVASGCTYQARRRLGDGPARLRRRHAVAGAASEARAPGLEPALGRIERAGGDQKLQVVGGTHPVVYPALGSHANYYTSALHLGRSAARASAATTPTAPSTELHRRSR
jgi:hypothetical protein